MYQTDVKKVTEYRCSLCDNVVVVPDWTKNPVCHHIEMIPLYHYTETSNGGKSNA